MIVRFDCDNDGVWWFEAMSVVVEGKHFSVIAGPYQEKEISDKTFPEVLTITVFSSAGAKMADYWFPKAETEDKGEAA